ncbi:VPS28 [Candida oxycetoniae]|uniref:Vacuolar protein sorting-associated protein 28 n=1 Tax=Candida oxycetoniae TaxID=497107 RepID=A0AAI9SU87_9ASCO|nr:VPS28 [Candida oxycetoniae]KAI3403122.2 VPS28 [Candida oxycetoniae]
MSFPPEYAPTASTSFTISSDSIRYNEEVTRSSLIKSPTHKSTYDALAEVCSIIPSIEMLENAYIKDYVTDKEKFTSATFRLIYQYQTLVKGFDEPKIQVLQQLLPGLQPDLSNFLQLFMTKFHLNCPQAMRRLISGVPSTIEHISENSSTAATNSTSGNGNGNSANARLIAEITGNFITCMDAIKLNYKTRDQLHPLLSELVVNLNELNENMEVAGKSKLVNWLIKINNLEKELNQEDADIFLSDLDVAYKGFYSSLEKN